MTSWTTPRLASEPRTTDVPLMMGSARNATSPGSVAPHPVDALKVAHWIAGLAAEDARMDVREQALAELRALGPAMEPYLRDARPTAKREQRARIDWLLECIVVTPINDEVVRRLALATRVLEIIGTPKAMALRRSLTAGK